MRGHAFCSLLSGLFLLTSFPIQALDKYTIDPMHTNVLWHVDHFGFSHPNGKWFAQGTLELDQAQLQNSKVNATIKIADLETGIAELDKHLKGKLFFDAAAFPTATFISDKVELQNNAISKVHGILTVHGIAKPIILETKLNKIGLNPINEKNTIGFSAHTKLLRSDFGIKTLIPGVSDEVMLDIEVEAYQDKGSQ